MELAWLAEYWRPILVILVVAAMFALFLRETYPTEVVALAGAALLLSTSALPHERALSVFSNAAPWTIAAMFTTVTSNIEPSGQFRRSDLAFATFLLVLLAVPLGQLLIMLLARASDIRSMR